MIDHDTFSGNHHRGGYNDKKEEGEGGGIDVMRIGKKLFTVMYHPFYFTYRPILIVLCQFDIIVENDTPRTCVHTLEEFVGIGGSRHDQLSTGFSAGARGTHRPPDCLGR